MITFQIQILQKRKHRCDYETQYTVNDLTKKAVRDSDIHQFVSCCVQERLTLQMVSFKYLFLVPSKIDQYFPTTAKFWEELKNLSIFLNPTPLVIPRLVTLWRGADPWVGKQWTKLLKTV